MLLPAAVSNRKSFRMFQLRYGGYWAACVALPDTLSPISPKIEVISRTLGRFPGAMSDGPRKILRLANSADFGKGDVD
jgi:hypothetical protein